MFRCVLSAAIAVGFCFTLDAPSLVVRASSQDSFVQTLDQSPHDTRLESAVRRFRAQVYETYRLDRAEFDRRLTAWNELRTRFSNNAGNGAHDYARLLAWLEQATNQSRVDVGGPLPEMPAFGDNDEGRELDQTITLGAPQRATTPTPSPTEPRRVIIEREITLPRASGIKSTDRNQTNGVSIDRSPATRTQQLAPAKVQPGGNASPAANASAVAAALPEIRRGNENNLNVGELLARSAGYSVGLRTLDSLLLDRPALDTKELSTILGELETLIGQRRDLLLYKQLVAGDQQNKLLRSLEFPHATITALGNCIERERLTIEAGPDGGQQDQALRVLEQLSQRLGRLSEK